MSKTLMVIDGHSLMYRAYYAMSPFRNDKGYYTNAVYGFFNMLIKAIEDHKPTHITVAFDSHGPTFRHEFYTEYKDGRKPTPDELVSQYPLINKLLEALKIQVLAVPTFEADDILGSMARIGGENHMQVILISGDKDILQLVDDHTTVLLTRRGLSDIERYTPDYLMEKMGLQPNQIPELKALMGDSSDNIPGVKGVGEKTALKLLDAYQNIDNLYRNVDDVKGKLKEKLIDGEEQARLSKRLAIINTAMELPDDMAQYQCVSYEETDVVDVLEEMGLARLAARIRKLAGQELKVQYTLPPVCECKMMDDLRSMASAARQAKHIALYVDSESFYLYDGDKEYRASLVVDLLGNGFDLLEVLKCLAEALCSATPKTVYGKKQWLNYCAQANVTIQNIAFDTELAAYLLNQNVKNGYDAVLERMLNTKHAGAPAFMMTQLEEVQRTRLKQRDLNSLMFNIELPLTDVIFVMEQTGFMVNRNVLEQIGQSIDDQLNGLSSSIFEHAGETFNINSPKQLGVILFEILGLPVIKKTKSGYSTDAQVLEKIHDEHPIVPLVTEYRHLAKLKGTYIDGMLPIINKETGRIYTKLNQMGAYTGRLSSTEPNLQNIPVRTPQGREIRKAFVATDEDHILVDADYSQIELRVLAHISGDENMLDAFTSGADIHRRTAAQVFDVDFDDVTREMRSSAKAVNFGIVYGISDFGLAQQLRISNKEAGEFIEKYLETFPGIRAYMEDTVESGKEQGFVSTLFGRRIYLPDLKATNYVRRSAAERIAMNAPIQGSAADIIKKAMIAVYNRLQQEGVESKLILQVHDELIVDALRSEADQIKKLLVEEMEQVMVLSCPLVVDVSEGDSWYDSK